MASPHTVIRETRELLSRSRLTRAEIETLARNGNLCGELPTPSGHDNGEPFWTKEAFIAWSETAKRTRTGGMGITTRGAVANVMAALLGKEREREVARSLTVDQLAVAIATGEINQADAEKQLGRISLSALELKPTVERITSRQQLIDARNSAIAARSQVTELQEAIDKLAAEIAAYRDPRLEKIQRLRELQQTAQHKAAQIDRTEMQLRETVPQDLAAAIAETRQQIAGLQSRPAYLRNEISNLNATIASHKEELSSLQKQIRQLTRPEGDYEATLWHKSLKEREEFLLADIRRTEETLKSKRAELAGFSEHQQELRDKLAKLEARQFDLWPKVAEII